MPSDFSSYIVSIEQAGRLTRGIAGTFGFINAQGAVTVSSGMVLNVAAVAANSYIINGTVATTAYTAGTVTITAADGSNPRLDIVWINSSGAVAVAAGTAAASPVPPTIGATGIELAMIVVGAGVTSIGASDIIDRRQILVNGWRLVGFNVAEQTMTSATAADLVTITGLSIPVSAPVMIVVNYRKTATTAQLSIGLKLNSTVVAEAATGSSTGIGMTASTNEAQDGVSTVMLGPRSTSYLRGLTVLSVASGATGINVQSKGANVLTNTLPNATITDVIIRGVSDASATLGVKEVFVYQGN